MAETAEQAEMRALKDEVARLKKTRAAVVKALEAQSWDGVRAALAHSESSTKRGYARRGATPAEKKANCRSMFSEEAYAFCERLHSDDVPMSSFHKKLDEAGYKPLHTSPKFTYRIVEQVWRSWKNVKRTNEQIQADAEKEKRRIFMESLKDHVRNVRSFGWTCEVCGDTQPTQISLKSYANSRGFQTPHQRK